MRRGARCGRHALLPASEACRQTGSHLERLDEALAGHLAIHELLGLGVDSQERVAVPWRVGAHDPTRLRPRHPRWVCCGPARLGALGRASDGGGEADGRQIDVPLSELCKGRAVREAEPDDADTFQHTVAAQLIQHERRVNDVGLLLLVRDDASHKVRRGVLERRQQRRQLGLGTGPLSSPQGRPCTCRVSHSTPRVA